jgi:hypothetical protein
MTPQELIADYRALGQQDLNVLLQFIADHLYELRLSNGAYLYDGTDFKQAFVEMAEELRKANSTKVPWMAERSTGQKVTRPEQKRWATVCHSCGHPHKDREKCGAVMGKDRECLCDLEVSA